MGRHSLNSANQWFDVFASNKISLNTWTHVVITWDHDKGSVLIYIDGKNVGTKTISPRETSFYLPTGKPYQIGNDDHPSDHQFDGSVMDLYVFGTALSQDEIGRLRGKCVITRDGLGRPRYKFG